jgi:Kef-type K+ transport system membrane component KefB
LPFALGAVLSLTLFSRLAPPGMSFVGFALFVGAAMSVTAFPVLARILMERGLVRTELGVVAVASAAVSDVTAWAILAGIIALLRSSDEAIPLWVTLCGSVLWTVMVLWVARPTMQAWDARFSSASGYEAKLISTCVLFALVSAFVTQILGVHALFGAFLAGAAVPRRVEVSKMLRHRIEMTTVVILLPVFFALTGLKTSVGLLATSGGWTDCALVTLVAIAGKLGGSALAARGTGMSSRDSISLGVLMNTRGLMELIILSIGLELGIITPPLFAMMVLMALVTTFMTSPLLSLLGYHGAEATRDETTVEPAMT